MVVPDSLWPTSMHSLDFLERAVSLASKEFIRGFIIGQAALLLILLILTRFLFFHGSVPIPLRPPAKIQRKLSGWSKNASLESLAQRLGMEPSTLPKRESCLWANALATHLLLEPLRDFLVNCENLNRLSMIINDYVRQTDMIGPINIIKFELGDEGPLIRWAEVIKDGLWEVRLEWNEPATLDVETAVILNWPPKQAFAALPCSFSFSVRTIAATLRLQIPSEQKQGLHKVSISARPDDFLLDLDIHSLIGHRSKLKDIPKLTSMLYSRMYHAISETILEPNHLELDVGELLGKTFSSASKNAKSVD